MLYACNHSLSGMEAMAGIPGSTGGACKMNAGAFNQEIKDTLLTVTFGSVFKRPEGNYAGTLIEKCGLKGYSIGGAVVSTKHANFILNENNATSSDIYNLIQHVIKEVKSKTGITLEPEVRLIGFNN